MGKGLTLEKAKELYENVLVESNVLVMRQSDYWYEKRKLIAYQYNLGKETNILMLDLVSNGESHD